MAARRPLLAGSPPSTPPSPGPSAGPGSRRRPGRGRGAVRGRPAPGQLRRVAGRRARLRQRHLQALERLVELLEARGDLAAATGRAERLLREDPLREPTYQVLMRLHDARGDRARALRVYHACAATLARELGAVVGDLPGLRPCCPPGRAVPPTSRARPPAGAAPLIGRPPSGPCWSTCGGEERGAACWRWSPTAGRQDPAGRGAGGLVVKPRPPRPAPIRPRARWPTGRWWPGCARTRSPPPGAARPAAARRAGPAAPRAVLPGAGPPEPPPDRGRRRLLFEAPAQAVATSAGRCCWSPTTCTGPTPRPWRSSTSCSASAPGPAAGGHRPRRAPGRPAPAARPARRAAGPRPAHRDRGRPPLPAGDGRPGRAAGRPRAGPRRGRAPFAETEGNPLPAVEAPRRLARPAWGAGTDHPRGSGG